MFSIHKYILKIKRFLKKTEPVRDYTKGCHNVPSGYDEMKRST